MLALLSMLAIVIVAIPLLAALSARRLQRLDAEHLTKSARYARIMLILWSVTALALYSLRLYAQGPADVGVRAPHHPWQWLLGLLAFLVLALTSFGRGEVGPNYARRVRLVLPISAAEWAWFVPLAATAGICEEFLYRGYALTEVARLTDSLWAGVILSTAAFGLAHWYQGRFGMIGATISGLAYAAVFVISGSVLPCMIGHFTQDIAGALVLTRRLRSAPEISHAHPL